MSEYSCADELMVLVEFEGGPDAIGYYIKGEKDWMWFLGAIELLTGTAYSPNQMKYTLFHKVPKGRGYPQMRIYEMEKCGRGTFPVTVVYIDKLR